MSGSIPTSNISFLQIVHSYNNVNSTNLSTWNISLSSFRNKAFSDSTTVPSSGAISLNSHFKGKTWGAPSLYTFSSHIFTNCGATGASGPTLSQCRSSYSPSWTDNTSYFNVTGVANGIQQWKVPATGIYKIDIFGAKAGDGGGATGGYGNRLIANHSLTQGEWIHILVGQMSADSPQGSGGGGGGTFVIRSPYNTNASILIIAGGGGGIESGLTVHHGTYYKSGGDFSDYSSATGGTWGSGGSGGHGQPGAGFLGDATGSFDHGGVAAKGFVNGGKGGTQYRDGGFGGGGSGGSISNGGGGGYSGGASGDSHGMGTDGAGGGGSHFDNGISGTISMWPADNGGSTAGTGQGKVTITKL